MLKFRTFILEKTSIIDRSNSSHNDPKAKVNETETALALGVKHKLPVVDFRDHSAGMDLGSINKEAKTKLPSEKAKTVVQHSHQLADAISDHLKTHHNIDLSKPHKNSQIAWTSQEGDIKKFTGKHDPGNPADIMVKHGKQHVGISLKYGKNPGLRSPGHKDMQNLLNVPHDDRQKIDRMKGHILNRVGQELEHSGHIDPNAKQKDKKASLKSLIKQHVAGTAPEGVSKAIEKAHNASQGIRANMVSIYHNHFNNADHETKTNYVRRMLNAEKTEHPLIKAHVNETNGKIHISDPQREFNNFHSHVESYDSEHTGGTHHTVFANLKNGERKKVLHVQLKHNSGVYTAVGGAVGAAGAALKKYGAKHAHA